MIGRLGLTRRGALTVAMGGSALVAGPASAISIITQLTKGVVPVAAKVQLVIPEIVEDGVTGLLVPPGDEKALAGALLQLCGDRSLAAAMGSRARALVAERFTWSTQAARLAEYYDELIGAHADPS